MIEVRGISKNFGPVTAVDDLSFAVRKGEILGFLGPNGAGKTTTMRILTCFFPPTEGTATVAGFDVFHQPLEVKRRIGYLPEAPPLYPEMTVLDYLDFVGRIKGLHNRAQRRERIEYVIEHCALGEVREMLTGKLSKGYRQRVGLAQALVHDPDVLILDEPTAGLDPKQIIETRQLIKRLAGQHTIILSTHILPEVSMTCERVVIISRGRVVAEDTPQGLTARLRGSEILLVTVDGPEETVRRTIGALPGVARIEAQARQNSIATYQIESTGSQDIRRDLARSIVEAGLGLLELKQIGMSLEDIYLQLTTSEEAPEAAVSPSSGASDREETSGPDRHQKEESN